MTDEPATVGLEPRWIAEHLAIDGVRPVDVGFEGFIGTGQMSRNARFSLTWPDQDTAGPARPRSVVVKLPSSEATTRAVSFEHRIYARECEFYSSVASLVDVSVPASLAVHFDADDQDFAIVLEDLVDSVQGDQFTEPTIDQLRLAVTQAAALHAPVWGRTGATDFDLYRDDPDERAAISAQMVPLFMATVMERLGPGLEPDIAEFLQLFADTAGRWAGLVIDPAVETVVHGDFRPDNFMFGVSPSAPPLVVVDWQTIKLGLGVTDVAYLLGGALAPERRRELEPELLALYRAELAGRGVSYPEDRCLADYAYGSLHGVAIAVTATTMADVTERGDALFTLMLNRHGRHAIDMGILDRFG